MEKKPGRVIQIVLSEPNQKIRQCVDYHSRLFDNHIVITNWNPRHKKFYDCIPQGKKWHWLRADIIRFEYCSENEDVLYLDWDTKVNYVPGVKGVTWAPGYDYWAFYNGNDTESMKHIIEDGISAATRRQNVSIKKTWLLKHIKNVGGETFPKDCIRHRQWHSTI